LTRRVVLTALVVGDERERVARLRQPHAVDFEDPAAAVQPAKKSGRTIDDFVNNWKLPPRYLKDGYNDFSQLRSIRPDVEASGTNRNNQKITRNPNCAVRGLSATIGTMKFAEFLAPVGSPKFTWFVRL